MRKIFLTILACLACLTAVNAQTIDYCNQFANVKIEFLGEIPGKQYFDISKMATEESDQKESSSDKISLAYAGFLKVRVNGFLVPEASYTQFRKEGGDVVCAIMLLPGQRYIFDAKGLTIINEGPMGNENNTYRICEK